MIECYVYSRDFGGGDYYGVDIVYQNGDDLFLYTCDGTDLEIFHETYTLSPKYLSQALKYCIKHNEYDVNNERIVFEHDGIINYEDIFNLKPFNVNMFRYDFYRDDVLEPLESLYKCKIDTIEQFLKYMTYYYKDYGISKLFQSIIDSYFDTFNYNFNSVTLKYQIMKHLSIMECEHNEY